MLKGRFYETTNLHDGYFVLEAQPDLISLENIRDADGMQPRYDFDYGEEVVFLYHNPRSNLPSEGFVFFGIWIADGTSPEEIVGSINQHIAPQIKIA